jgi:hypothetical protein
MHMLSATSTIADLVESDEDQKLSLVSRMAVAIIKVKQAQGGCLPQDLLELGFTKDETIDNWHMASAMANVELKIMGQTEKKHA